VTGIANGGFFASDLLQRFPDLFAGAYLAMAGSNRTTTPIPSFDHLLDPSATDYNQNVSPKIDR